MSYEILQQGIGYVVVVAGTHQIVGRHKTRAEAMAHLRALYDSVRLADGVWEVVDWVTGKVVATLADETAARTVYDIMLSTGQLKRRAT